MDTLIGTCSELSEFAYRMRRVCKSKAAKRMCETFGEFWFWAGMALQGEALNLWRELRAEAAVESAI